MNDRQFIKNAREYILSKIIMNDVVCSVCGKKIYPKSLYWREFLETENAKYYKYLSSWEKHFLHEKVEKTFLSIYHVINNHHICYNDDFTIEVCEICHGKIHNRNEECYMQYKPIDQEENPVSRINTTKIRYIFDDNLHRFDNGG